MAGPDFSLMLAPVAAGMAQITVAVLAVFAALIWLYVNVKGVRFVVDAVRGRLAADTLNREFQKRYQREQKRRQYREWKTAQIGPRRRRRW